MKINNIFSEIYDKNLWNGGSGPGSNPISNQLYISLLERFLTEKKISSIVDAGCGDWQFSKFINWNAGFNLLSKNLESNSRIVNRCVFTGRNSKVNNIYMFSRLSFLKFARSSMIPGIFKASW